MSKQVFVCCHRHAHASRSRTSLVDFFEVLQTAFKILHFKLHFI
jgi:hypothetical protein